MPDKRRSKRINTRVGDADDARGHADSETANDDTTATKDGVAGHGNSPEIQKVVQRRKKGLLAQLTEFPLDVLLEVRVVFRRYYVC
jgi:hypothetical protein